MASHREHLYACTYASGATERRWTVCAWSADEALERFESELRAAGVRRAGTLAARVAGEGGDGEIRRFRPARRRAVPA